MKVLYPLFVFFISFGLHAQSFELLDLEEVYHGNTGDLIRIPIKIKNLSEKTLVLALVKEGSGMGMQKSFLCPEKNCFEQFPDEYSTAIEPLMAQQILFLTVESGLVSGTSSIKLTLTNKSNPSDRIEKELRFEILEKSDKNIIYSSNRIEIQDVYPNPATDAATVNYRVLKENVHAKIVLHNILGNPVGEYALSPLENRIKIPVENLSPGIYFYTLHVDNNGVMTRKLIIKR